MPVFADISQAAFLAAIDDLAGQLRGDAWRADALVGIGRGGLVPAVYLSHATGIPMVSLDYSHAQGMDDALAALAARSRAGERLLVVDDINDTGRTIARLREGLAQAGATDAIRFAVLIDNVSSGARVDYRHRTIDRRVTKDWFVFPWEAVAGADAIAQDAAEVPDRTA